MMVYHCSFTFVNYSVNVDFERLKKSIVLCNVAVTESKMRRRAY